MGDVVRFITTSPLEMHFVVIMDITDDDEITINVFPKSSLEFGVDLSKSDDPNYFPPIDSLNTDCEVKFNSKEFKKNMIKNYGKHIVLITPDLIVSCGTKNSVKLSMTCIRDKIEMNIIYDMMNGNKTEMSMNIIKNRIKEYDKKHKIYVMIDNTPHRVKLKHDNIFIDGKMI